MTLSLLPTALLALPQGMELPPPATGELFTADFNNDRVAVFAADGTFARAFTTPGLNGTRGIAFAPDGTFFVASQLNSTIYRFAPDETVVGSFTHPQMPGPTGIAISPSGELFVSSFNGARLCVFDLAGTFQRSITAPGFTTPNCVGFDDDGNIYAVSAGAGAVFKWDPTETFLFSFDVPPPFSLTSPMGVAQKEGTDVLYVSGGSSHNVVKFTTDGTFLGELTHPDLTGPQGVVFDDRGHLFSSSFYQDRIVEFDENDQHVQTLLTGGLDIPRSLAFHPGRSANEFPSLCAGDGGNGAGCTACPCGNESAGPGGCLNDAGTSAELHVFGTASTAAADLRFEVSGALAQSFGILLSGTSVAPTNPAHPCFGLESGLAPPTLDGLRCAVGSQLRHGTRATDTRGRIGADGPAWGAPDGPTGGLAAASGLGAGTVRVFQVIYRTDEGSGCGSGLNTTQARRVSLVP